MRNEAVTAWLIEQYPEYSSHFQSVANEAEAASEPGNGTEISQADASVVLVLEGAQKRPRDLGLGVHGAVASPALEADMQRPILNVLLLLVQFVVFIAAPIQAIAQTLSPADARAIAKEAYIYGFPLVDSYRVQYSYFVDKTSPEFRAPWNRISSTARVFTPHDKAIQTPNSDTPYSFLGLDLRKEPIVLSFPVIQKERYYSAQFIDLYTFNDKSKSTPYGRGQYARGGA